MAPAESATTPPSGRVPLGQSEPPQKLFRRLYFQCWFFGVNRNVPPPKGAFAPPAPNAPYSAPEESANRPPVGYLPSVQLVLAQKLYKTLSDQPPPSLVS